MIFKKYFVYLKINGIISRNLQKVTMKNHTLIQIRETDQRLQHKRSTWISRVHKPFIRQSATGDMGESAHQETADVVVLIPTTALQQFLYCCCRDQRIYHDRLSRYHITSMTISCLKQQTHILSLQQCCRVQFNSAGNRGSVYIS